LNKEFTSDLAIQYQKRFKRNRGKLFSFLDYDGVSWNNNNAEYAFKHFAVYRHKVNGIFSESGIKAYLVLLSIYQTCQYKQLSFLDFLLSKEEKSHKVFTDRFSTGLLALANFHVRGEVGLAIGTFFHLGPPLQKRNDTNQTNQKTKMNKEESKGKNQRFSFSPMIGIIRKDI